MRTVATAETRSTEGGTGQRYERLSGLFVDQRDINEKSPAGQLARGALVSVSRSR